MNRIETIASPGTLSNETVLKLDDEFRKMPQVVIELQHQLSGGMYARTGIIKAGCCLIGAQHKTDHINILYGDISVSTDDGVKRLTGYHVLTTKAGNNRVGVAHSDTVWTTVCKTDETELDRIEDELVVESDRLQSRSPALPVKPFGELLCSEFLRPQSEPALQQVLAAHSSADC